jgi:hypothetical protein
MAALNTYTTAGTAQFFDSTSIQYQSAPLLDEENKRKISELQQTVAWMQTAIQQLEERVKELEKFQRKGNFDKSLSELHRKVESFSLLKVL